MNEEALATFTQILCMVISVPGIFVFAFFIVKLIEHLEDVFE